MRVLGVDHSLTGTGVVRVDAKTYGDVGTQLRDFTSQSWLFRTTKAADGPLDYLRRMRLIEDAIREQLKFVDLLVIEGASFASGPAVSTSAHERAGLWWFIVRAAHEAGIRIMVVPPSNRMQYGTGVGNASKQMVMAAAIRAWPQIDIKDDNVADAAILAGIGCRYLGLPIDTFPASNLITKTGKNKGNWFERLAAA